MARGFQARDGYVPPKDCTEEQGAALGVMNRILQEVWAEPTGTWNKPLENSKPSPKALDVRVEGDITSSQFSSNIL